MCKALYGRKNVLTFLKFMFSVTFLIDFYHRMNKMIPMEKINQKRCRDVMWLVGLLCFGRTVHGIGCRLQIVTPPLNYVKKIKWNDDSWKHNAFSPHFWKWAILLCASIVSRVCKLPAQHKHACLVQARLSTEILPLWIPVCDWEVKTTNQRPAVHLKYLHLALDKLESFRVKVV